MAKAAIFASGRGSNFIAIYNHLKNLPTAKHNICCLVSDKPDCPAVAFAKAERIPIILLAYPKEKSREAIESELIQKLLPHQPELLVLAGFMRLLSPVLVHAYAGRIINIHPSLLPKYPGKHGIAESYHSGDKHLGITIHYVDEGLDSGPIIVQKSFERQDNASLEAVEQYIHDLEHQSYPLVVQSLLDSQLEPTRGGI